MYLVIRFTIAPKERSVENKKSINYEYLLCILLTERL